MNKFFKKLSIPGLFLLAIILLSVHYHKNEMTRNPSFIHAWTQADYYSIALGFTEDGYDFFHPQTYLLNKQFPNNFGHPYSNGITSIDFPIHEYIPALLMGLTGSTSPFWMRIYTLLYSLVGLLFLFLLAKKISSNVVAPYAIVAFVSLSPVFIYYQATFIPTIPSLANVMIGYYFFFGHLQNRRMKEFWLAILFFTLAAIARTPFAIFLIAAMCHQALLAVKKRKISISIMVGYVASFLAIGGYFLYNLHLRHTYGSIFLGNASLPDSLQNFKDTFWAAYYNWRFHYFTFYHYIVLAIAAATFTIALISQKVKLTQGQKSLAIQVAIASFGAMLYAFLMTKQFKDHDYYLLDSLFLPVVLATLLFISAYELKSKRVLITTVLTLFLFVFLAQRDAHKLIKSRQQITGETIELTVQNYANSQELLDSLKIGPDKKILVLGAYSSNNALCEMRRTGYSIFNLEKDWIQTALTWPFDYITVQNCLFPNEIVNSYPQILSRVERVGGNENISILKLSNKPTQHSVDELLGFTNRTPHYSKSLNFEEETSSGWFNTQSTTDPMLPQNKVGYVDQDKEWGPLLTLHDSILAKLTKAQPVFRARLFSKEKEGKILLIASLRSGNEKLSERQYELNLSPQTAGEWHNVELVLPALHPAAHGDNEYVVYLWNVEKRAILYDDLTIDFY